MLYCFYNLLNIEYNNKFWNFCHKLFISKDNRIYNEISLKYSFLYIAGNVFSTCKFIFRNQFFNQYFTFKIFSFLFQKIFFQYLFKHNNRKKSLINLLKMAINIIANVILKILKNI